MVAMASKMTNTTVCTICLFRLTETKNQISTLLPIYIRYFCGWCGGGVVVFAVNDNVKCVCWVCVCGGGGGGGGGNDDRGGGDDNEPVMRGNRFNVMSRSWNNGMRCVSRFILIKNFFNSYKDFLTIEQFLNEELNCIFLSRQPHKC